MRQLWAVEPQEKFGSGQHRPRGRHFLKAPRETVLGAPGNSGTAPPGLVAPHLGASPEPLVTRSAGRGPGRWEPHAGGGPRPVHVCLLVPIQAGPCVPRYGLRGGGGRGDSCFVTTFCDSFEAGQLPPRLLPAPLPVLVPGPVAHPAHHGSPCQLRNRGCFCLITTLERHKQ